MSRSDPIQDHHLPVDQERLGQQQQNAGVHSTDDNVPFRRHGSPVYSTIVEATVGVIILVVAVFAIGRYIARSKKVVVKDQEYISGSSADGWARRDLEAGPVDISALLGGQSSRDSSRPHEHTAVELHGTTSMKKRLGKMFSRMNSFQKSLFGMRLSQFCSLVRSTDNPDLVWTGEVGAGSYGRVSLVLHDLGVFAIKELAEVAGDNERAAAEREMDTILTLGYHQNVVMVYAIDNEINTMPILMEAAAGDMWTSITMSRFSFEEDAKLLHGAACGLAHVHSCGKVHGDVKPSNVLIVPNDTDGDTITFTAKIADFGFTVDHGDMTTTGTIGYGAPEMLWQEREARQDMDVFSFGVLMLQTFIHPDFLEENMFAHSMLISDAEEAALADIVSTYPDDPYVTQALQDLIMERTINDGSFQATMIVPDKLRPDIPDKDMVCVFIKRCLSLDRASRPTMQQVAEDLSFLSREPVLLSS